jgi:multiple sugar transport system ATP-binding protein
MNFFPATVTGSAGAAAADTGFARVPLGHRGDRVLGREVTLGVRPEDIHDLGRAGQDGRFPVEAQVEVVEYLGNELQLHLSADGRAFIARVSTETQTQPGASLRVGFDTRKLHIFDKATEEAL